jgi:hypothetical protein
MPCRCHAPGNATFAMAKGGGAEIGPTKRGKGMKIMAIVDRHCSRWQRIEGLVGGCKDVKMICSVRTHRQR